MAHVQMATNLVAKVTRLDQLRADRANYSQAVKLIKELVNGFNSHELTKLVSLSLLNRRGKE